MVSLVIYGIVAIALASAAGYALLTVSSGTHQTEFTDENDIRMEAAVTALRASLLALAPGATGGILFPPMGSSASDNHGHTYTSLPTSLGVTGATPWAVPYSYCPIAPAGTYTLTPVTPNVPVTMYDASTYTVSTYTTAATQGVAYVVANPTTGIYPTAAAAGYVGFIISSPGPGQPVPDCSAISLSGTTPTVTGGFVRGITAGFAWNQRVVASVDRLDLWVATASSGDGTGRDVNNPTLLASALTLWQSLQPRQTDIHLAGGTFSLASNLDALNDDTGNSSLNLGQYLANGENTSLIIAAEPSAAVTVSLANEITLNSATTFKNLTLSTSSAITAYKPLTLDGVTLSGTAGSSTMQINGTTLTVNDSAFTGVATTLHNSFAEFYNRATTNRTFSDSPIVASMSHIEFDGASTSNYTFNYSTSTAPNFTLTNSSFDIENNATITTVSPTSTFLLSNSRMSVNGALNISANGDGIEAHDGSVVSIATTGTVLARPTTNYTLNAGAFLEGSQMGLQGSFTVRSISGTAASAIALRHGVLTSNLTSPVIHTPTNMPCVGLNQGLTALPPDVTSPANTDNGTPTKTLFYPLYIDPVAAGGTTDMISFAQAQRGMPPLTGVQNTNPDAQDTANISKLTTYNSSQVQITFTNQVFGSMAGYVPYANLEPAIRNFVNAEFLTGSSLDFVGTCVSP